MSSETNYGFGTYTSDSDFVGIGPRIGLDAEAPLSGNLSADRKVAGAVLFGKRDAEAVYGGAYTYNSDENDVVVPNLEGSVGLNYLFGENMSAAIGYRADAYWNVIDTGNGDGSRLIHGPFARVTVNFGGGD